MNNRDLLRDACIFALLAAIGVLGRWGQPDWNFTPLAAVTVMGGFYFRSLLPAVLLPVTILAISDVILPTHTSVAVQISVHVMMLLPLVFGRLLRSAQGWQRVGLGLACGIVPATAFYLVTNFVHWAATGMYEKSLTGLAACYAAGIPFFRSMLAGDIFYMSVLALCFTFAWMSAPQSIRSIR